MAASKLLGDGAAPPRAFGGGTAIVATRPPSSCTSTLRGVLGAHVATCSRHPVLHLADGWHYGGGWRWHDDGRAERLPRIGGGL